MAIKAQHVDKWFLISILTLVIVGFFIFGSASLGLLAKEKGNFGDVLFNQTFFGLFLGTISLITLSQIHYRKWRKYSLYIFLFSVATTLLVFVPGLGFEHGGAKRWIDLGVTTFQPAELLKIGFVIYFAAWLSGIKSQIKEFKFGLIPFLAIMAIVSLVLIKQPDIGTLIVIFSAGFGMFIAAGAKWRDIFLVVIISLLAFVLIATIRPHVRERLLTYINPAEDMQSSSYQLQQSLIAIGAGGFWGRGFGQSIQKFSFLPEPVGDSIFAVAAEEFGFIGSIILIFLFLLFTYHGLKIARNGPDLFGGLLVTGIVILIISQSFINMASMLGVVPLSGLPLLFVSHGGTALFFALSSVGIILNVSRYKTAERR